MNIRRRRRSLSIMKFTTLQGTEGTLIFNPEITIEGDIITVSATTVFHNSLRYDMREFKCEHPNEIWFNLGEYSVNKATKRGAFRVLWRDDEDYVSLKSLPPPISKNIFQRFGSFVKEKIAGR